MGETIESVLSQTVPPFEIIVVNDGSTDGTAEVLRGFGHRIRVVSQPGRGAAAARNAGAAVATGQWLAFVDADDTWLPTKIENQLACANDRRIGMVYTDRFNVGARGDLPEVQSQIQHLYSGDVFLDLLRLGSHITLSSVIVRTDLFRALGGFSETLRNAEDWDLWIRVAENHVVAVCPEPLVRYRFHAGMKSGHPQRMQIARNEITQRALESSRGRTLSATIRRQIRASTARANASDAARRSARGLAWQEYGRGVLAWPFQTRIYRDILRFVLGRAKS